MLYGWKCRISQALRYICAKAVYYSGCRDEHKCLQWDPILGFPTAESYILPLDHRRLLQSVADDSVCVHLLQK